MSQVLRVSLQDEATRDALGAIIQRLNEGGGGSYEMSVANSLWGQADAPPLPEFLDLVARHYDGGLRLVDFRHGAATARATINDWVEDKTKRKIRELIPPGGVRADTRLVLVNAVYFNGKWTRQFSKPATRDEPFHLDRGGTVQAPLMRLQGSLRYLQAKGFQALELYYRGGDLAMLVLLPDEKKGLADLEANLSVRLIDDCVAGLNLREVKVFLPRFKITWGSADLAGPLAALGMTLAFNEAEADFSGINGRKPPDEEALFVSAVFHKAFVDVDEEGTEAAAATAAVMTARMAFTPRDPAPIPVFRADHPFLFAIRDRKSGLIIFLGRMADPTRES